MSDEPKILDVTLGPPDNGVGREPGWQRLESYGKSIETSPAPNPLPRGSQWCFVTRHGADKDDPDWCWCRHEIVSGIGQCPECQEDVDA